MYSQVTTIHERRGGGDGEEGGDVFLKWLFCTNKRSSVSFQTADHAAILRTTSVEMFFVISP